jgi:VWFA-related protein
MRIAAIFVLFAAAGLAQFKSTVPLVVAPTTVVDSKGRFVDGLTTDDLILYDNNVPQPIQMDWMTYPISLVVIVQTSTNAGPVIDKLDGSGILFTQLLAAEGGETAIISVSDEVNVRQAFTRDPDLIIDPLRKLQKEGSSARILDAMLEASSLLERRPPGRRRILLVIAEKQDRGSATKLPEVLKRIERLNAQIYWLAYSPYLQSLTVKPKTVGDVQRKGKQVKDEACMLCPPPPDDTPIPIDPWPGGLGDLFRLNKPDLSNMFPSLTGGRRLSFLKKGALEHAIGLVAEEVHRQYILTFQPKGGEPGTYHALRVAVKNRPELAAKTRTGYWALP